MSLGKVSSCLSQGFYCYDKTQWPEAGWGGMGLFDVHFHIYSIPEGSQGKNSKQGRTLEAGTEVGAM